MSVYLQLIGNYCNVQRFHELHLRFPKLCWRQYLAAHPSPSCVLHWVALYNEPQLLELFTSQQLQDGLYDAFHSSEDLPFLLAYLKHASVNDQTIWSQLGRSGNLVLLEHLLLKTSVHVEYKHKALLEACKFGRYNTVRLLSEKHRLYSSEAHIAAIHSKSAQSEAVLEVLFDHPVCKRLTKEYMTEYLRLSLSDAEGFSYRCRAAMVDELEFPTPKRRRRSICV